VAKRYAQWFTFHDGPALVTSGVIREVDLTAIFQASAGLNSLRGYTLIRMIGELAVRPVATGSSGLLDYATGFVNVGAGANPNLVPQDDNASYTWYYTGNVGNEGAEVSSGVFGAYTRYIKIDSRAMRKTSQQEERFFYLFHNASTLSMTVGVGVRCLYKLP